MPKERQFANLAIFTDSRGTLRVTALFAPPVDLSDSTTVQDDVVNLAQKMLAVATRAGVEVG